MTPLKTVPSAFRAFAAKINELVAWVTPWQNVKGVNGIEVKQSASNVTIGLSLDLGANPGAAPLAASVPSPLAFSYSGSPYPTSAQIAAGIEATFADSPPYPPAPQNDQLMIGGTDATDFVSYRVFAQADCDNAIVADDILVVPFTVLGVDYWAFMVEGQVKAPFYLFDGSATPMWGNFVPLISQINTVLVTDFGPGGFLTLQGFAPQVGMVIFIAGTGNYGITATIINGPLASPDPDIPSFLIGSDYWLYFPSVAQVV